MAKKSKCVECKGEKFELAENKPINSKNKILLVQCATCGTVVGAMDQYDIGYFVSKIAAKMGITLKKETK